VAAGVADKAPPAADAKVIADRFLHLTPLQKQKADSYTPAVVYRATDGHIG